MIEKAVNLLLFALVHCRYRFVCLLARAARLASVATLNALSDNKYLLHGVLKHLQSETSWYNQCKSFAQTQKAIYFQLDGGGNTTTLLLPMERPRRGEWAPIATPCTHPCVATGTSGVDGVRSSCSNGIPGSAVTCAGGRHTVAWCFPFPISANT